jgi:hypothetical protein
MKKAVSLLTLISLIASVFVLPSCSLLGLALDAEHFPDKELRYSLRSFDSNGNGYLSKKELKEAKSLLIWGDCYDLTGIEYLTNLESLGVIHCHCSDFPGIESLTNLKTLSFQEQCPDLSGINNLTNLEKMQISRCVFSERFVFKNESPVTEFKFSCCVFEKGILFDNDLVKKVIFEDCAVSGGVVIADCDGLIDFSAYFDAANKNLNNLLLDYDFDPLKEQRYNVDLSGCDNLDYVRIENGQVIASVDLSNCRMLKGFSIIDLYYYGEDKINEATLNICGSPNVEYAHIGLSGLKELDISDCPHLISATEQTPNEAEYNIKYKSKDGYLYASNERLVLIKD